jgi:hypothetical protein
MSSGSSGKSVIVPDPSRSMFCFMRRILRGILRVYCLLREVWEHNDFICVGHSRLGNISALSQRHARLYGIYYHYCV